MVDYVTGDATEPVGDGYKVIAHICNDRGAWGAGFVKALSAKWSKPEAKYREWSRANDPFFPFQLGYEQYVDVTPEITVCNMVAQTLGWKDGKPPIRYDALAECLTGLGYYAELTGASVHMPRIGTGLAGGAWYEIEPLIKNCLEGISVTVYDLE